jgi:DNA-directed RNA polymerase specialized sigma24 family protein
MEELDLLRSRYLKGELSKKKFEELIFKIILSNPQRLQLFNRQEDRYIDYLCWLYPRLSNAIDSYKETGSTFAAYVSSLLYWTAKEYKSREQDRHFTEAMCWEAQAEDLAVYDEEPPYLFEQKKVLHKKVAKPQHILILLLKSYAFLSDDFLERIALSLGVSVEKLHCMLDSIRGMRAKQDEYLRNLKERIHSQHYKCISLEKKRTLAQEGSIYYTELTERLERGKALLAAMRKRLLTLRPDASNRQIAEVLGLPKGTVDSNLYAIKRKYGIANRDKTNLKR